MIKVEFDWPVKPRPGIGLLVENGPRFVASWWRCGFSSSLYIFVKAFKYFLIQDGRTKRGCTDYQYYDSLNDSSYKAKVLHDGHLNIPLKPFLSIFGTFSEGAMQDNRFWPRHGAAGPLEPVVLAVSFYNSGIGVDWAAHCFFRLTLGPRLRC